VEQLSTMANQYERALIQRKHILGTSSLSSQLVQSDCKEKRCCTT